MRKKLKLLLSAFGLLVLCFPHNLGATDGDVNGIGNTDLSDVVAALQICAGMNPDVSPEDDEKIGLKDAIFALQIVAGIRPQTLFVTEGDAPVSVNLSLLEPSASQSSIQAVLPDGETAILVNTENAARGDDNYTWFGEIEEYEGSTAVLSVVDGSMFGHIDAGGSSYFIQPEGDGYKVVRNDPELIAPHGDDAILPDTEELRKRAERHVTRNDEDGSFIDVLVLYTAQMQTKYGNSLSSLIQHFVDLTNHAYTNSGINTKLRLAHAELYDNSDTREGSDGLTALYHIKDSAKVSEIRNLYKADLVSLLRVYPGSGSYCGLGFVMPSDAVSTAFESHAFSVVEVRPINEANPHYCSELSFAHELGHNLGCAHDREHVNVAGAYDYSYGYDIPGEFATIMSYDYPEISYFSTPQVTYQGNRIGKDVGEPDSAYNALTINNTRVVAANFRVNAATSTTTTTSTTSTTTTTSIASTTTTSVVPTTTTTVASTTTTTTIPSEGLMWNYGNWNEKNWN